MIYALPQQGHADEHSPVLLEQVLVKQRNHLLAIPEGEPSRVARHHCR